MATSWRNANLDPALVNWTELPVVNKTGLALDAGKPLQILGYDSGSARLKVGLMENVTNAPMDCVLAAPLANDATGIGYRMRDVETVLDTTLNPIGSPVFCGDVAGSLVTTARTKLGTWRDIVGVTLDQDPTGTIRFLAGIAAEKAVEFGTAQTLGGASATILSFGILDGEAALVTVKIVGQKLDGSEAAGYTLIGTFKNIAGVVTQAGATSVVASHEDDATAAATLSTAGITIDVAVTSPALKTYNWRAEATIESI